MGTLARKLRTDRMGIMRQDFKTDLCRLPCPGEIVSLAVLRRSPAGSVHTRMAQSMGRRAFLLAGLLGVLSNHLPTNLARGIFGTSVAVGSPGGQWILKAEDV